MLKTQIFFGIFVGLFFGLYAHGIETVKSHGYNPYRSLKYSRGADHMDYVNPQAPKGGEIRLGTNVIFDCLNAMDWGTRASDNPAPRVYDLLFDTLMQSARDRDYSYYGLVAEEVETAVDDSFVLIHLNPAARFSNGEPVTAEDVVFSYQYVRKAHYYYDRQAWLPITSVQVIDAHTLRFEVDTKDRMAARLAISALGEILILNKKFTEKYPRETWGRNGVIPLGSGPYAVEFWSPRKKIVYKRRKDYWAKNHFLMNGRFNFDRISYTYYADVNIQRIAVEKGDLDFINESKLAAFDAIRKGHPELITEIIHSPKLNRSTGILLNTQRPIFKDRRVRKALALAFPFALINHMMFDDFQSPVTSFFSHSEYAHEGPPSAREVDILNQFSGLSSDVYGVRLTGPELNADRRFREGLKEAADLLTQAGWRHQDGRLVDASGRPFHFDFVYSDNQMDRWLMLYRHFLSLLGIDMELVHRDETAFVALVRTHDYDSRIANFRFASVPERADLESYFGSEYAFNEDNASATGITNPNLDQLIRLYSESLDNEERTTLARVIDRVLLSEHYVIPFGQETKARLAYSRWLRHEAQVSPRAGTDPIATWWSEKR